MVTTFFGRYYLAAWIAFMLVWIAGALTGKRTERVQSGASRFRHSLIFALGALLLLFPARFHAGVLHARFVPRAPAIAALGLAFTVAGTAIAIWARFYLGGNWSGRVTIKEGHELVRSGPYRFVRHPIYTGMLLALAGVAVGIGEVHALVGVAVMAAAFRVKSRLEEKFMLEQFGEKYEHYQKEVKALIPFAW